MITRPCSDAGARVQLALKTWVWADLPALKVLAQVTPYATGKECVYVWPWGSKQ